MNSSLNLTALEELGLSTNERAIFTTLALGGEMGAAEVAKRTGLNRPYVYYALERLLEKGFTAHILVGGRKKFKTLRQEQILTAQQQKVDLLAEQFAGLAKEKLAEVSVEVLKGKFVIKTIFKMIATEISKGDEHLCLGVDEARMEEIEPVYLKRFFNQLRKHGVKERVIIKRGGRILEYATTSTYRTIDPGLIGNTVRFIYHDTVVDIIYGEPTYAIVIKNKELAETARRQFEVFWKIAAPAR